MKNTNATPTIRTSGFSLFEMLTFVCILGTMVSIAIPLFGNVQGIKQATAKRNAQSFCTLAHSASAAGKNVAYGTEDKVEVLKRLVRGVTIEKGVLKGREFKLPNMTEAEIIAASAYVHISQGDLVLGTSVPGSKVL
jgi:hypothetical protein